MNFSRRRLFGFALAAAPAIIAAPSLMRLSTAALVPYTRRLSDGADWTYEDLTLAVEEFSAKYLRPQMIRLCEEIDGAIFADHMRDAEARLIVPMST